jgi:hypothetical protein
MNRFDTLKIGADFEAVKGFNPDVFVQKLELYQGSERKSVLTLSKEHKILGLSGVTIEEERNRITLELSGKIMGSDYYDLIHKNNAEQLVRCINDTECIRLDTNRFLDSAEVYKCDTTNNLPMEEPVSEYIGALEVYALNGRFAVSSYGSDGIVFTRKVSSYKERDTAYDKFPEMEKKDRKNLDALGWQNHFQNLRFESNHVQLQKIRERFGVLDTKLIGILNSTNNVNLEMFERIILPDDLELQKAVRDFEDLEAMKGKVSENEKLYGRRNIIRFCKYDMFLIRRYLRNHSKGNPSRMIKLYELELIEMMKESQSNIFPMKQAGKVEQYIRTIRDMLKVA